MEWDEKEKGQHSPKGQSNINTRKNEMELTGN
jgi:hypothetical protein